MAISTGPGEGKRKCAFLPHQSAIALSHSQQALSSRAIVLKSTASSKDLTNFHRKDTHNVNHENICPPREQSATGILISCIPETCDRITDARRAAFILHSSNFTVRVQTGNVNLIFFMRCEPVALPSL